MFIHYTLHHKSNICDKSPRGRKPHGAEKLKNTNRQKTAELESNIIISLHPSRFIPEISLQDSRIFPLLTFNKLANKLRRQYLRLSFLRVLPTPHYQATKHPEDLNRRISKHD